MKIKLILLPLLAVLVISALPACSSGPKPSSSFTAGVSTPYFISEIPTPAGTDKCTITGTLTLKPGHQPVKRTLLALAVVIVTKGTPVASSLSSQNAPRTLTDDKGRFVFSNVTTESYTLVLDQITSSFLLSNPATNEDMIINCAGGKVVDMGELEYTQLPIPTPMK